MSADYRAVQLRKAEAELVLAQLAVQRLRTELGRPTSAGASAVDALVRRARMGLLLAVAGGGRDRFDFWQGYAKGAKDVTNGTGSKLAAKDEASPYRPLGGFEAAAKILDDDIELLSSFEVAHLLAQAGVEVSAEALAHLDVVAAHQLDDGEFAVDAAHCKHAAARVVQGNRSNHGVAPSESKSIAQGEASATGQQGGAA